MLNVVVPPFVAAAAKPYDITPSAVTASPLDSASCLNQYRSTPSDGLGADLSTDFAYRSSNLATGGAVGLAIFVARFFRSTETGLPASSPLTDSDSKRDRARPPRAAAAW